MPENDISSPATDLPLGAIDTAAVPASITVHPNAGVPLIMNLFRQVGIVVGGAALIAGTISNRDLSGFIALMQGEQLAPMAAAILFLIASISSFWKTVHNELVKRKLANQVGDDVAVVASQGGLAKLIIAMIGALGLAGCATMSGGTPAQRLFEARGDYVIAVQAAADYAESPGANPVIVRVLKAAKDQAQPSVDYVDAYVGCHAKATGSVTIGAKHIDCATFSFTATSISGTALALRNAAASLVVKP